MGGHNLFAICCVRDDKKEKRGESTHSLTDVHMKKEGGITSTKVDGFTERANAQLYIERALQLPRPVCSLIHTHTQKKKK